MSKTELKLLEKPAPNLSDYRAIAAGSGWRALSRSRNSGIIEKTMAYLMSHADKNSTEFEDS